MLHTIKTALITVFMLFTLPVLACSGESSGPYYVIEASALPDLVRGDIGRYVSKHYAGHGYIGETYDVTIETTSFAEESSAVPVTIRIDRTAGNYHRFYISDITIVAEDLDLEYVYLKDDQGNYTGRVLDYKGTKSTYSIARFSLAREQQADEIKFRYKRLGPSSRLRAFATYMPRDTTAEKQGQPFTLASISTPVLRGGNCGASQIMYSDLK